MIRSKKFAGTPSPVFPFRGEGPRISFSLEDFDRRFPDEKSCWAALVHLRWPKGVICETCQTPMGFIATRQLFQCRYCRTQTSATAGTIFHKSRLPLHTWFSAIFLIATSPRVLSARSLQQRLSIKSYRSAWMLVQNIRGALVRNGRLFGQQLLRGVSEEAAQHAPRHYSAALALWYQKRFTPEDYFDRLLLACVQESSSAVI